MEDHASKVEEEKAVEAEKAVDVAKAPEKDAKAAESQAEKPKKKTGLIAAIAVGAVLLVAGSVFAFVKLTEKEPKEVVITAFENVYADDRENRLCSCSCSNSSYINGKSVTTSSYSPVKKGLSASSSADPASCRQL